MPEVTLILLDDWEGLYVDGVLEVENHALQPDEILKALGIQFKVVDVSDKDIYELPKEEKDLVI